jgi:hypothetical protein
MMSGSPANYNFSPLNAIGCKLQASMLDGMAERDHVVNSAPGLFRKGNSKKGHAM